MSLITCYECAKEISDRAIACPQCGVPRDDTDLTRWPDGKIKTKKRYRWGKEHGSQEWYHKNGQPELRKEYEYGEVLDGLYARFSYDGYILQTDSYKNGILRVTIGYHDDLKDGSFRIYNENGQATEVGFYKRGKRSGPWCLYHDNGQLLRTGTYRNDNRHGVFEEYSKEGKILASSTFKDGELDGLHKMYREDMGGVCEITTYKNGLKHGPFAECVNDGESIDGGVYHMDEKCGHEWWSYYGPSEGKPCTFCIEQDGAITELDEIENMQLLMKDGELEDELESQNARWLEWAEEQDWSSDLGHEGSE